MDIHRTLVIPKPFAVDDAVLRVRGMGFGGDADGLRVDADGLYPTVAGLRVDAEGLRFAVFRATTRAVLTRLAARTTATPRTTRPADEPPS